MKTALMLFAFSSVLCFSAFADEKLDDMLNKQYGESKKDKPADTVKPAEKPAEDKSSETSNDENIDDMLKKLYGEDKKAKPAEIAKPADKPTDKPVDKKSESTVQNSIRDARSYIPSDIFKNAKDSVVIVVTGLGWGSGFAVSPDGLVVTNKHVVTDDNNRLLNCVVTHPSWNRAVKRCEIVKVSDTKDLALIRITDYKFNDYPKLGRTDDKSLPVGAKVYALGHPGSSSGGAVNDVLSLTFTEGIVSGKDRVFLGNKCLQTTATINHGNSGGPLLDENCLVVGVNTFGLIKLENTFFAVTIEEVQNEFGGYLKK